MQNSLTKNTTFMNQVMQDGLSVPNCANPSGAGTNTQSTHAQGTTPQGINTQSPITPKINRVILALGANIGDSWGYLCRARKLLRTISCSNSNSPSSSTPGSYLNSFDSNSNCNSSSSSSPSNSSSNSSSSSSWVQSTIYSTAPMGPGAQNRYLNQVICFETHYSAQAVLLFCKGVEVRLGRKPRGHWYSREIDIDVLYYNQEIIEEDGLRIPHPHIAQRSFVLVPLAEIAPHWRDPQTEMTAQTMLDNLGIVTEQDIQPVHKPSIQKSTGTPAHAIT
jgi:2-amino-4-hydroxy-6-hydroxymethyldihydropteridine diphosphokinase